MARYERSYTGERRTAGIGVKLTPSERRRLEERAAASGAALSDYVRALCLRHTEAATTALPVRRNPEAKALADELRAIGINLNQLARVANQTGEMRREDELEATIRELKAAVARVITL